MKQVNVIPGYFHVSAGNYASTLFPESHPFASATGILTDGDIEEGVVVFSFLLMNWGLAFGISWTDALGID